MADSSVHAGGTRLQAAVALALALLLGSSHAATLTRESGRRTLAFTGAVVSEGLELPDGLVVADTDTIRIDGELLVRGVDYSADYLHRRVEFLRDVPDSSRVSVSYLYLPLETPAVFRRALEETSGVLPEQFDPDASLILAAPETRAGPPASALRFGGAKTFGVTMGSDRDLSLEQSLRLNVNGRITRDVEINAYLSDQNTPLSPEGDTEELRAIDQVLVEIEGEHVAATMGDYRLNIDGGPLLTVDRDLKGASARAEAGPFTALIAGASASGEFGSSTFMGVDGKQGPYLLSVEQGGTGTTIVAGSERVWFDGARLKRGRDNDYTIDYAAGEVRFTEKRPVTSDNEITVDYEYSLTDYDRDIYGGRGTVGLLGGRASLGVGFFREADDVDTGTGSALSDEQREILAAAGDDPGLAHDDGIDYVGDENGDYTLTDHGHFEYAGPGEGEYSLSFERVDSGDYDYDYARGYYVFAGQDSGDYDLGRDLALPVDHVLAEVDGRLSMGPDGEASVQAALSSYDRNRFSNLDDEDNLGNAAALQAKTPSLPVGGDLFLNASAKARRVAGGFRGIGRYREVDYVERWELSGLELPEQEELLEVGATARSGGGGRVSLSLARLDRGGVLEADRVSFSGSGSPWGGLSLRADGRVVALDHRPGSGEGVSRERAYVRAGADYRLGRFTPGVGYARDERTEDGAGGRYDEYEGALAGTPWRGVSFRGRYAVRKTQVVEDENREDESTVRTHAWTVALERWSALTLDGSLVRREVDYESGALGSDSSYDLVSLRLGHRSRGGGVAGELRYTVTSTEIEIRERYVTEEDGVEVTRIVSTGVYEPVTDLEASTKWTFKYGGRGGRGGGLPEPTAWRRFLSGLTLETDVRVEESTKTDEKRRLYALDPGVLRGDDTVRGVLSGRHTLRYTRPGGGLSARLAVTTRSELNRAYANTEESRAERAATLDLKLSRRGGVTYRVQGDVGTRDQDSGTSDSYELDVRGVLGEIRAARMGSVDGRVTASYTLEDDTLNSVDVSTTKVTPSATLRFKGRGALTASYSWIDVDGGGSDVPTYMAEGRRDGATSEWRLSGDYRVNTYLTTSLTYSGERRPGDEARHTLDLRVNAFF